MTDAIARYHELLTAEVAEETHTHLTTQLARHGLDFGGRPLCTVLRPRFISVGELKGMQARIRPLMAAFGRAYARAVADDAFRAKFGLLDWEETLLADRHWVRVPSPTSRLDFFHVPATGALALTEYNAETPAGAAYNDALSDAFIDAPAMRAFSRHFEVLALPTRAGVIGALLEAWREFSRSRRRPRIAILDWDGLPTATEFTLYQHHLRALGYDCVIDDPRRTEYRDGSLFVQGAPVDLIYKRVLISELIEACGLDHGMVRAVRDRAVCMVDGFHCKVLHKKASLAVLSDEANADTFDRAQRSAIADCIPWTRVVSERHTTHGGETVDLVPYIVSHKDHFVLKPNDDYGGKGITLGWAVDGTAWEAAVREALAAPYIVQERVAIPSEAYPSWVDGGVVLADRMFDTAPFVSHGEYMEGMLTRLSTAALLNVTAGGGSTVPTFVVEER
jgi:hypothetical protein